MSPYILSCMLAASLNPAQHPMPNECERAYVSMKKCMQAKLAIDNKWTPVCYAPTAIAADSRTCRPIDTAGTNDKRLWTGREPEAWVILTVYRDKDWVETTPTSFAYRPH